MKGAVKPLSVRAQEIVAQYLDKGREGEIDRTPAAEFALPKARLHPMDGISA